MDTNRLSDELLRRELLALKSQGCALLVINDPGSVDAICRRLGGDGDRTRRRCFVSLTTTIASVLGRHSPSPRRDDVLGIIDVTTTSATRTVAAPIQPGELDVGADWYDRIDDFDSSDPEACAKLVEAVEATLSRFEARAGSLGPGECRLCLESLDPFIDGPVDDDDRFVAFLESMTTLVRDSRAIGHFHVAEGISPNVLTALEPFFDATIHVRTTDSGVVQQRWFLHDEERGTGWLPVTPS